MNSRKRGTAMVGGRGDMGDGVDGEKGELKMLIHNSKVTKVTL